jgi:hypothetical protein
MESDLRADMISVAVVMMGMEMVFMHMKEGRWSLMAREGQRQSHRPGPGSMIMGDRLVFLLERTIHCGLVPVPVQGRL